MDDLRPEPLRLARLLAGAANLAIGFATERVLPGAWSLAFAVGIALVSRSRHGHHNVHDYAAPDLEHAHEHTHAAIAQEHPHVPDLHHRHRH